MAPYEETLFAAALLGSCAFVVWLAFRFATERARERERRSRLVEAQIEKFAEAGDFVEFARSEVGLAWLRADSGEMRVRRSLLGLTVGGVLLLSLGSALFVNAARLAAAADPGEILARAGAAWWGTVLLSLGAGSLVSSFLIARIGRSWELLPPANARGREAGGE